MTSIRDVARRARESRAAALVFVAVVLMAVVLVAVIVLLRWGPHLVSSSQGLTNNEAAQELGRARRAVLALVGGSIALLGAIYTARTFGLNQQGQFTERFTRAVDQLGNSSVDVRLGGIYALERLARESRYDHGPIVEILTAYAREHSVPVNQYVRRPYWDPVQEADAVQPPTIDIHAAVSVLGRRRLDHERNAEAPKLDLRYTHLYGAKLGGAHLAGADLGNASLDDANLSQEPAGCATRRSEAGRSAARRCRHRRLGSDRQLAESRRPRRAA